MTKYIWTYLLVFALGALHGMELDSSYSIVVPEPGNDTFLNEFDQKAATLFALAAKDAAGLELAVVNEGQFKGGKAVFIGNTMASRERGMKPQQLSYQECLVQAGSDGSLYFSGRYSVNPEYKTAKGQAFRELGTLRGVCEFLRKYAGMRVFLPNTRHFRKGTIAFPDDLNTVCKPVFLYVYGRQSPDPVYDIANGFLNSPWNKTYGGHSHSEAITKSMFKEHPEYFALISNGKRWGGSQLCLSNPQVQELIYQEMLKRLDAGFEWVQLGQADGFSPCLCEPCKNLFGVADWSEKIWILHRDMAERLHKERPGKKVVILCYHPNDKPPRTFKEFPDNVIIELCKYTEADLQAWQKLKVPGGFICYVYNWGAYAPESFTPRFTPAKAVEQIKLFTQYNISAIFRCGFGDMFGLEGPCYYAYGAAINEPSAANADKFFKDYCSSIYGAAGGIMEQFYEKLYKCQEKSLPQDHTAYHTNLGGLMPAGYANHKLIALRYPEETLKTLEDLLKQGEAAVPENQYVHLVRREWDFLSVTARMCAAFNDYIEKPAPESFAKMKAAVEARDAYLTNAPQIRGHLTHTAGNVVMGQKTITNLRDGGSYKGRFVYPVNWDLKFLETEGILPGARELECGGKPQKLIPAYFGPVEGNLPVVGAEMLDEGIKVTLTVPGVVKADMFYVIIGDDYYVFRCTYRNADIYMKNEKGKTVPKQGVDKKLTVMTVNGDEMSCFVPWSLLPGGKKLEKGASLPFNVYGSITGKQVYIYEPDIYILNGRHSLTDARAKLKF